MNSINLGFEALSGTRGILEESQLIMEGNMYWVVCCSDLFNLKEIFADGCNFSYADNITLSSIL